MFSPGSPGDEYIVKVIDTAIIRQVEQEMLLHDSLKSKAIRGFIRYAIEGYNKNWSWEFRVDSMMGFGSAHLLACDFPPRYVEDHLDEYMVQCDGWYQASGIVKGEVFPIEKFAGRMVFPNPASDKLNIFSDFVIIDCLLFDSIGRLVMKEEFNSSRVSLTISTLNKGAYLLKVKLGNGEQIATTVVVN